MTISDYILELLSVFASPQIVPILGFVLSILVAGDLFRVMVSAIDDGAGSVYGDVGGFSDSDGGFDYFDDFDSSDGLDLDLDWEYYGSWAALHELSEFDVPLSFESFEDET